MMKNLHTRLARLERQSPRAPATKNIKEMTDQELLELTKHIKEMTDEELLKLLGLPLDASDEDIDALANPLSRTWPGRLGRRAATIANKRRLNEVRNPKFDEP
jgi:hypothetical protein